MDDKLKYPNYGAMVRAQPPVLQTVGQGVRPIVDTLEQQQQIRKSLPIVAGALANQAPKVLGVPAAGIANAVARGVADFQTGFTGQKYSPQQFEAKSFTDIFGSRKAAPSSAPVAPANPVVAAVKPDVGYTTGAGLPSREQVAADKSRARVAQEVSDRALGVFAPPSTQPTSINVERQANGVLAFTGVGNGGTGVQYTGLPNFTTQQGGAGKGAFSVAESGFNLAEQNARMASALQGIRDFDRQKKADELIDAIASGRGGAVGVAQNKIALASLGDLVQRQMANENATSVATINANTQKRAQDLGLKGDLARVGASIYGVDVGAATADKGFEVEKQKAAAAIAAAAAKARTGKAMTAKDQTALFVFAGLNADGTPRTPAQQAEVERRYASSFGNRDSLSSLMSAYQVEP